MDDSFRFLERYITNSWGLGNLQTAENEANLLLPLRIQKLKGFQLEGSSPPNPLTRGSAPGLRCGLHPRPPLARYRLAFAMSVHPTYFDLATPLHAHRVVTRTQRWCSFPVRQRITAAAARWWYGTRCYFNVRSKANMSQLNLPHGTDN